MKTINIHKWISSLVHPDIIWIERTERFFGKRVDMLYLQARYKFNWNACKDVIDALYVIDIIKVVERGDMNTLVMLNRFFDNALVFGLVHVAHKNKRWNCLRYLIYYDCDINEKVHGKTILDKTHDDIYRTFLIQFGAKESGGKLIVD